MFSVKKRGRGFARSRASRKRHRIRKLNEYFEFSPQKQFPLTIDNSSKYHISALIDTPIGENRPHASVCIFDKQINGLLDSGANVTVVGNGAENLFQDFEIEKYKQKSFVKTADGTKLQARESILLPIKFNNQVKYIQALIIPEISKALILGMNFWHAFGISPVIDQINSIEIEQAKEMTLNSKLTDQQKEKLAKLLRKFEYAGKNKLGRAHIIKHKIDIGDEKPVKQNPYIHSPALQKEINDEIDRMLKLGIIEKSSCPKWLSPIIPVRKTVA